MNKIVNGVANDYEFPFLEKTTENYYQVMNRYYTEEFVKQLQQELQRKDNEINDLKSSIADYQEAVGDYQDELKRKDNEIKQLQEDIVNHIKIASEYKEQMIIKDNIINELKKYLEYEIEEWKDVENEWGKIRTSEDENILDKIKELENEND